LVFIFRASNYFKIFFRKNFLVPNFSNVIYHWNGYGIKAAMEYLAQEINSTKSKNKLINQK